MGVGFMNVANHLNVHN